MLQLITDLGDIKLIWKEMQKTGKQILRKKNFKIFLLKEKKKNAGLTAFYVNPVSSKGTFTSIYMQLQIFREEVRRG